MEAILKPEVGMEFDTLDEAWEFWKAYGGRTGFRVRKEWHSKSKKDGSIISQKFVCSNEGFRKLDKRHLNPKNPRQETRTGCMVKMLLKWSNGKFKVHEFVEEHNHKLHTIGTSHMLPVQRKISKVQAFEIELAEDSELRQKASFDLINMHVGGRSNLGYTCIDVKNHLKSRRQRNMSSGEAGALLDYFQKQLLENQSYFHGYQIDSEEQITNVFWADPRMLIDYEFFGDVVSLDTTFDTNKKNRPLVVFCGFNHYKEIIIFGAALLYDETVESFKWLFETFLEAHRQRKPITIFTKQDATMTKALNEVMPDTVHGLCTWHLMQNANKHLSHLLRGDSHILTDLSQCMYNIVDEQQFEAAWTKLLANHNVEDNQWLASIYSIKKKWAACFMRQARTLGMQSTQLSESFNADLKILMKPDLDIVQFVKHFEMIVEDKRYNELKSEYDSRDKIPQLRMSKSRMLKQLSEIYTCTVFELFQKEYDDIVVAYIKERNESQPIRTYVVALLDKGGDYSVSFDPSNKTITCSCRMFDSTGVLCCHALKIYDVNDVKLLPDQYILHRWTKKARTCVILDVRGKEIQADPRLENTQRFKHLNLEAIRLFVEASNSEEGYSLMLDCMSECRKRLSDLRSMRKEQEPPVDRHIAAAAVLTTQCTPQPIGFKQRDGMNSKKRNMSRLEG